MQKRYRLFRRGNVFYSHDSQTGKQESLRTAEKIEAQKLLFAKNEASTQPFLNLALGRVYLAAHDFTLISRTWESVMAEMIANAQKDSTRDRSQRAFKNRAFDRIRKKRLCETSSNDFLDVLRSGRTAVNHYLRRLHNLAIKYGWLAWPILPPKAWPRIIPKGKRGITFEEHQKIIASERNPEWRHYLEILWEIGAAQTDAANLRAEDTDWQAKTLAYRRQKTGEWAHIRMGDHLASLLKHLPQSGSLFQGISRFNDSGRAWHFSKLCKRAGVIGVTLHSYRYAWAERAKTAGYPERWAQAALGHNSRAVHQAYARQAKVICPSLEEYEKKIVSMKANAAA